MKNLTFLFLFLFSLSISAQPILRKGDGFVSQTDTNAWLSDIRFGNIRGNIASQTNLQNALNAKENSITGGTTGQYWRGDKSFQTLDKSAVGLSNVLNVTQEPAISAGTSAQYWRGDKTFQTLNPAAVGLGSVLNVTQEPAITGGTTSQYWRGDKTFQTLNSGAVGLGNVLNVTQEPAISAGNTGQYWRGDKTFQTLDKSAVGLSNVLNVTQEPAISTGPAGTYWANDKTWKPVTSFTGDFMLKTSPQGLQDTSTHSKIFFGRQSVIAPEAFEDFVTFDAHAGSQAFQLQYGHNYNDFWIRGRHPGTSVWRPWRKLVFSYDMDTANTRITNYINNEITEVKGSIPGTFSYTYLNLLPGVTITDYNIHKYGNVVNMTIYFTTNFANAAGAYTKIFDLPIGARPTQQTYAPMAITWGARYESGNLYVTPGGSVYAHCGRANESWVANLTWIQFIN